MTTAEFLEKNRAKLAAKDAELAQLASTLGEATKLLLQKQEYVKEGSAPSRRVQLLRRAFKRS